MSEFFPHSLFPLIRNRQAEKLAEIYFQPLPHTQTTTNFSHGFSFCLEATLRDFLLSDIFVLLQSIHSFYSNGITVVLSLN